MHRFGFCRWQRRWQCSASTGCATKNYVRTQTAPLVEHTDQLDQKTAAEQPSRFTTWTIAHRRASSRRRARRTRPTRTRRTPPRQANDAETAANDVVHRADSLDSVVKGLDNYKPVADVSVTFGFDKSVLTKDDKAQLDSFAAQLGSAKSYILEVTGGTDSTGPAQYNYELSQRRADAVVQYLASQVQHSRAPLLPDRHRQGSGSGAEQHARRPQAESPRADPDALEHGATEITTTAGVQAIGSWPPQLGPVLLENRPAFLREQERWARRPIVCA